MRPLFSATNTRPSGEKRTAVGSVSPEKTISSWKPGGSDAAAAGCAALATTTTDDTKAVIAKNVPKHATRRDRRRPSAMPAS